MSALLNEAMECVTREDANKLVSQLVAELMGQFQDMLLHTADYTARRNIAYHAGRFSHETRDRVERLFNTAHPVFGSIRYNGAPTPEQVKVLGLEFGRATREHPIDAGAKIMDAMTQVSEIPRVDAGRANQRDAGLYTRALDVDGEYREVDLARLGCESLVRYLQSRGGRNVFAERVVLQILNHELPEYMRAPARPYNTKDHSDE